MTIASICQTAVDTVRPDETVVVAAQRMASRCVGTLVVVDAKQRVLGIVTDRDLALRVVAAGLDPHATAVADVMSGEVAVIDRAASVDAALAMMREHHVRRLPVVDSGTRLLAIVSLEDVLALLSREMAEVGAFLQATSPSRLATS